MDSIKEFWNKSSKRRKITTSIIVSLVFLSILGNLFPGDPKDSGPKGTQESESQVTFDSYGCLRVSEELVNSIGQAFEGSTLSGKAAGFEASDYADVKFVSVEFRPNGDTENLTAVFATNDDDLSNVTLNGLIIPVDGFAKEFTDLGVATKLDLSIADKGAKESIECLSLPGAGLADQEAGLQDFDQASFIKTAKAKYGVVDETYDDGSTLKVMTMARSICEGSLEEMKRNLGGDWSTSFQKFAIESLCPEKLN